MKWLKEHAGLWTFGLLIIAVLIGIYNGTNYIANAQVVPVKAQVEKLDGITKSEIKRVEGKVVIEVKRLDGRIDSLAK